MEPITGGSSTTGASRCLLLTLVSLPLLLLLLLLLRLLLGGPVAGRPTTLPSGAGGTLPLLCRLLRLAATQPATLLAAGVATACCAAPAGACCRLRLLRPLRRPLLLLLLGW
jgi:hypothetical protein